MDAFRETQLKRLCPYGEEVAEGTFHRHGVREVDEVDGDRAGIAPRGNVEYTGARDFDGRVFIGGPLDRVTQKLEMVGGEDLPEGAIDVEGKIGDTTGGLAEVEAGDVGFGCAGGNLLHGEGRITGDGRDGGLGEGV